MSFLPQPWERQQQQQGQQHQHHRQQQQHRRRSSLPSSLPSYHRLDTANINNNNNNINSDSNNINDSMTRPIRQRQRRRMSTMTASTILNNGSGGTISTTRRRRRRSSLEMATAAVLAVAAVALTSTSGSGAVVATTDQFGQPTARPPSRPRNPNLSTTTTTTTTTMQEEDDSHHQHQQQQQQEDDDDEESHQSQFQQSRHAQQEDESQFSRERHLATTSAATFAHYTSARITNAIPFDLKLDRSTGQGYVVVGRRQDNTGGGGGTTDGIMMEAMASEQVAWNDNDDHDNGNDGDGDGGKKKVVVVDGNYYLEQYGQAVQFATNYNPNTRSSVSNVNVGNDGNVDNNNENAIVSLSQIMPSDEEVHHQSKHTKAQVFQELMEEVIAEEKEWVATNKEEGRNNNKGLRGRRLDNIGNNQKEEKESESREEEDVKKLILNLNYIHFRQSKSSSDNNDHATAADDGHDEQEEEDLEYDGEEEGDDEDLEGDEEDLEGNEEEENFHDAQQEQDEETITTTITTKRFLQGLPQDNHPSSTTNNNNNNMTTKAKSKNKNKNKNKNRKNVKIKSLTPDKGSIISSQQTFTAKIKTFNTNKSRVESVQFQLTDPTGSSSDWLNVPPKNEKNDLFQITVDGFQKYKGTRWTYKMKAKDTKGNIVTSNDILVKVDGVGGSANDFSNGGGGGGGSNTNTNDKDEDVWQAPPAPSSNSNSQKLKSNIQDSNWPYGGSIQSATGRILFEFTNTGTYVCSGTVINDGSNTNGRSIIVTAAHCAYSDTMKQFAKKAVFIPDQVSTRGNKSDWDCGNDRYGCWALSFGVVEKGWASNSFPANVQYDYAFYVVDNSPNAHSGGYSSGLSGILEKDVQPANIDFNTNHKDFTVALGYSADKDPNFRYCSMDTDNINGVPWYTNLWLDDCGMTGGASGGPWTRDMDESGVGTVISVNSWGFMDKKGMAGPGFRTANGSFAECLYDKAKNGKDPGSEGGIIVDC